MPQIFDVTANENARYKRNELECRIIVPRLVAMSRRALSHSRVTHRRIIEP